MNLAIITFTLIFVSSRGIDACFGFDHFPSTIRKTNDAIIEHSSIENIEDDNDRTKRSVVFLLPVSDSTEENQDSGDKPPEEKLEKVQSRSRQERCKSPSTPSKPKRTILPSTAEITDENSDKNQYFRVSSIKNAQNLLKSVLTSRVARGDNKVSRDEVILKPREQDSVFLIAKNPKKPIDQAPKKYVCYCVEEGSEPTVSMKNPINLHGIKRKIQPDVLGERNSSPVVGRREKPSGLVGSERVQDRRQCPNCPQRPILPKEPATSGIVGKRPIIPQRLQRRPLKLKTPPTIQPCLSDTEQVEQPTKFNIPLNNEEQLGSKLPKIEKKLNQGSQIMQPALRQNEPRVVSLPPDLQASLSALQSTHGYLPNERANYDPYTSVPIGPNIVYPAPYMIYPQYQQYSPYPLHNDGLVSAGQTGNQPFVGQGDPSCDENIAMPHKDSLVDMDECIKLHGRDYCMIISTSRADDQENEDNSNAEQGEPVIGAARDGDENKEASQQSEEYDESQPKQYSSDMELPTASDGFVDSEQRPVQVNNSDDYEDDVESRTPLNDAQSLLTPVDPGEREDYSDTVDDFERNESPAKATEYSQFLTPEAAGNVQAAHGISSNDYFEMTIGPSEANTVSSGNENAAARNDQYFSTNSPEVGTSAEFANEQGINVYTTMENDRYETTPILGAGEPENFDSSSPLIIVEPRTSSPWIQDAEDRVGDIPQTTPFGRHNMIQSTTEHTSDVKYDGTPNYYSQFVGSDQSTTETIDRAIYQSDYVGEPLGSSTDRYTTSYNILPKESSSTTMNSYELGVPRSDSSGINSFSTTERSGSSRQRPLQETSENEWSLGNALTTLRNVYTSDDDSIDHTSMRTILEESMATDENFTIDDTQQNSHPFPEYDEELNEPVGIGNPANSYSDRLDDEPHSRQPTLSTPLYNNPSTYSTILRNENEVIYQTSTWSPENDSIDWEEAMIMENAGSVDENDEENFSTNVSDTAMLGLTEPTSESDILGNSPPMANAAVRSDSLTIGSTDEKSVTPDDPLSEPEPDLSSSMMVDEHRYENGHWTVVPVDIAANDGNIEQQIEMLSKRVKDIVGRPENGLQRPRLPPARNAIVKAVEDALKNTQQNTVDPSAILNALKHIINRVEMPQTHAPDNSPTNGQIGTIPPMLTNNQAVNNLPVFPVTEHFFEDGRWSEKQAVVGNERKYSNPDMAGVTMASREDQFASSTSSYQASTVDANEFAAATGATDYAFLGDSEENEDEELTTHYRSLEDIVGITEGTSVQTASKAPKIYRGETEDEDIQTVATKYYSPNSRMMTYLKNIRDPGKARKLQDERKLGAQSPRPRVTTEDPPVGLELRDLSPTTEPSLELARTTEQETFQGSEENVGGQMSTGYYTTESIVGMTNSVPIPTTRRIPVSSRNGINEEGTETIWTTDGREVMAESVSPSIQLESRRILPTTDPSVELVMSSEQSMVAISADSRRVPTEKPMPYNCTNTRMNDEESVGSSLNMPRKGSSGALSTSEGNPYSEASIIPQSLNIQVDEENTYTTTTSYVGAEYLPAMVETNGNVDEEITGVTKTEMSSTIRPLNENVRSRDYTSVQYSDEDRLTLTENPEGNPALTEKPEENLALTENPEENLAITEKSEGNVALTENPQNNLASTENAEESRGLTENPEGNLALAENAEDNLALTENPEENLAITEKSEGNVALTGNPQNNLASAENAEESRGLNENPEENVDTVGNTETPTSQSPMTNINENEKMGNSLTTVNFENNLKVVSSTDNIAEEANYSATEQFETDFKNGIDDSPGTSDTNGQILESGDYGNVDQGVTIPGYVENTLNDRNQLGSVNKNEAESTSEISYIIMQTPEPDYAIPEVTKINSAQAATSRDNDEGPQDFSIEQVGSPQEEHVDSDRVALSSPGQSSTLDYDPTYFGKITLNSLNPDGNKISDLKNADLFYVGDGVKIPLKISRMNDGSWSLSISDKICESFIKKKCPCCAPNDGDIVEERRRRNTVEKENYNYGEPMSSESSDSFESPNNSQFTGQPKNRHPRSPFDDDVILKIATPVEKFAEKYDLTFDAMDCPVDSVKSWRRMKTRSRKDMWNDRRRNRTKSRNARILKLFENNNGVHRDNSEEIEDREIDDDKKNEIFKKSNVIRNARLTFDAKSDELVESLLNGDQVPESLKTEIVVNALDDLINSASAHNLNPMIESYRMVKPREENSMQDQWDESDDYNLNEMANEMTKYGYQRDNPIWERVRFVKKKQNERGPYRYQRTIDHRVMGRMNVWKTVLQWLKRVFLESRAYDET